MYMYHHGPPRSTRSHCTNDVVLLCRYLRLIEAGLGIPSIHFLKFSLNHRKIDFPINTKFNPTNTYGRTEYSFESIIDMEQSGMVWHHVFSKLIIAQKYAIIFHNYSNTDMYHFIAIELQTRLVNMSRCLYYREYS